MSSRVPPIRCHCPGPCPGSGSQTEYARHAGVNERSVRRYIKDGRVPTLADSRIDFVAADRHRENGLATVESPAAVAAAPSSQSPTPGTMADAQRRHEEAKARFAELRVAEKEGQLLRASEVERTWFGILRSLRTRLVGLSELLCAELAATSDEHVVRTRIDAEVHAVLNGVARDVEKMAGPTPRDDEAEEEENE